MVGDGVVVWRAGSTVPVVARAPLPLSTPAPVLVCDRKTLHPGAMQVARCRPPGAPPADGHGRNRPASARLRVAHGDAMRVGAPDGAFGTLERSGAVYIVRRAASGSWVQETRMQAAAVGASAARDRGIRSHGEQGGDGHTAAPVCTFHSAA
jgi:hypothetical protein